MRKNVIDMTGVKCGMLTGVKLIGADRGAVWLFKCDCGNFFQSKGYRVRNGHCKSCGCQNKIIKKGKTTVDKGQRFGMLSVISKDFKVGKHLKYVCLCDCGNIISAFTSNLLNGNTKACGCQRDTVNKKSKTKEYRCWNSMMNRCYNEKNKSYKNYGGRGIEVDVSWHNFFTFLNDMGQVPDGMSIDRINNNGNYSPDNCKWSTVDDQANNKRNNKFIEYKGKRLTLAQWSRETGIRYGKIQKRIKAGWDINKALEE